jgi:uncharacterized membrane protein
LALLFRWLHILAAITAVGGTIYARFALLPAAESLAEPQRAMLLDEVRRRWFMFVNAAILFLIVSGLYNFVVIIKTADVPKAAYHSLFLVKLLLALAIFFLASMLNGRSATAAKFRQNARFWLNVNVGLGVAIVLVSGMLRSLPHPAKTSAVAATTSHAAP